MNILIAPDSFKDALPANEVAKAIAVGLLEEAPHFKIKLCPLADGGEGTLQVLEQHFNTKPVCIQVHDPLWRPIQACYAFDEKHRTAFIEMAEASGLERLLPNERNPLLTTTYGTGELIKDALHRGAKELILAIGGSATNDAGIGMAKALGYRFFDAAAQDLSGIGGDLIRLKSIDSSHVDPALASVKVQVLCDVDNPLYGPDGAAYQYAAQKGATASAIEELDVGLRQFGVVAAQHFDKTVADWSGAGAAGGLGAGAMVFLSGQLRRGIELVMELTQLACALQWADLVITGEGRIDKQSLHGKVIQGITQQAAQQSVPVLAVCGSIEVDVQTLKAMGIQAAFAISDVEIPLEQALAATFVNLRETATRIVRLIQDNALH